MTQNIPEWMRPFLGQQVWMQQMGIHNFATVNALESLMEYAMKSDDEYDAMITKELTYGQQIALYAAPLIIAYACIELMTIIRNTLISSRVVEPGKASGDRITDLIKKSSDKLDEEFRRLGKLDGDSEKWMRTICTNWYDTTAIKEMTVWRNVYSSLMLKKKMANQNENLRDLLAFAMVARAVAHQAIEFNKAIKVKVDEALASTGVQFRLHGRSVADYALTAADAMCDRFGLPSYEADADDLQVTRCNESWARQVGNLMIAIEHHLDHHETRRKKNK